ncbi:hypothetical protein GCM10009747_01250 [Agromyces humatus]|uniref:Uncharacterized protein n=1 Tax=Agromyces humatus TaxID=279573 RepID=A0ABN2K4G4_9MICO
MRGVLHRLNAPTAGRPARRAHALPMILTLSLGGELGRTVDVALRVDYRTRQCVVSEPMPSIVTVTVEPSRRNTWGLRE